MMTTRVFYHKETGAPVQITASAMTKPTFQDVICYQELTKPYKYYVMEKSAFFAEYVKEYAELPLTGKRQIEKKTRAIEKHSEELLPQVDKAEPIEPESTEPSEKTATQKMLDFLDADNYHEKIKILGDMKDDLDEHILNNMAVSLDLSIEEGMDGYRLIMSELRMREKYESTRGERL